MARKLVLLSCLVSVFALGFVGSAQADFSVNDLDATVSAVADGNCDAPAADNCTLPEAILEANNTVGLDTITFSANGTITLANQLTTIEPTVIDGNGPANTIIDGNDTFRLFIVNNVATTFKDIRLQDGGVVNPAGDGGAAILGGNSATTNVTLDNAVITSNQVTGTGAGLGAGIFMQNTGSTLNVNNSTVSDNIINVSTNAAVGGGIAANGPLNLTDSTVSGNTITSAASQPVGGGIHAASAFNIQRSTVSGNTTGANGQGAGLNDGGVAGTRTITNSTFSTNSAGVGSGGGMALVTNTTLTNVTFALNAETATTGNDVIVSNAAVVTLKNTILGSGSAGDPACNAIGGATVISTVPGNNIDSATSPNCGLGTTNGNRENTNPLLGPLALNPPGTTMTHALLPGSPAFNTATPDCGGLTVDQRGVSRPQGAACDVGSFELAVATPNPTPTQPTTTIPTTAPSTPTAPKKCKKGQKLRKGKCVKKKRKK
jgi:hypothetical protein